MATCWGIESIESALLLNLSYITLGGKSKFKVKNLGGAGGIGLIGNFRWRSGLLLSSFKYFCSIKGIREESGAKFAGVNNIYLLEVSMKLFGL